MMENTQQAAERIAGYGANKMDAQGYVYEQWANYPHIFNVTKPATDTNDLKIYFVSVQDGGAFKSCTCPFFKANKVCKHAVRIDRLQQEDAALEARAEAYHEYETYGKYDLMAGKF